jgi:hypothetical protein
MKNKNVIGHIVASKNAPQGWFRRLNILPRVLCLLAAILIWLLVVNMTPSDRYEEPDVRLPVVENVEQ